MFFVCLGLTSHLSHITTVPACSSSTLTNVLPHRNVMPQTQDMTPNPITVYRHRVDLLLCYSLMWNVTLEYTTINFNVLGKTRPEILPRPSTHSELYNGGMVVVSWELGRKYRTHRVVNPGPAVCEFITLSARLQLLLFYIE